MKHIKHLFALAAMLLLALSARADHDQVITFDRLPAPAQAMHKQYFADKVPMVVTMDWDDYTILYQTGEKVEFDHQGNWKKVSCRATQVPPTLVPDAIKTHVSTTFPGVMIVKFKRNAWGYEAKLTNGLEVDYDINCQVVSIDD